MATTKPKTIQGLTKKHAALFKQGLESARQDSESLEQPYIGEIVETVTTYSVYGEPPVKEE
jgi:hypothetical protein